MKQLQSFSVYLFCLLAACSVRNASAQGSAPVSGYVPVHHVYSSPVYYGPRRFARPYAYPVYSQSGSTFYHAAYFVPANGTLFASPVPGNSFNGQIATAAGGATYVNPTASNGSTTPPAGSSNSDFEKSLADIDTRLKGLLVAKDIQIPDSFTGSAAAPPIPAGGAPAPNNSDTSGTNVSQSISDAFANATGVKLTNDQVNQILKALDNQRKKVDRKAAAGKIRDLVAAALKDLASTGLAGVAAGPWITFAENLLNSIAGSSTGATNLQAAEGPLDTDLVIDRIKDEFRKIPRQ